jgi:hypothetical protein
MSQQINLLNQALLKKKDYFSTLAMLQGMGMIIVGAVFFYVFAASQVTKLEKQSEETSNRYAAEQLRLANFAREFSPEKNDQMQQDELKKLEAETASQKEIVETLKSGAIGNIEGYSEYMRAFARQVVSGLWLNGFDIVGDGAQISLSGGVVNPQLVPSYVQRLNREKVMRGKTFASLQMKQPKAVANKAQVNTYLEFSMQSVEPQGAAK